MAYRNKDQKNAYYQATLNKPSGIILYSRNFNIRFFFRAVSIVLCAGIVIALPLRTLASEPDSLLASNHTEVTDKPYLTKEFEVNCPGSLKIFTVAGDITVEPSLKANKVKVELYLDRGFAFWSNSQNLDNFRITMLQRGDEIVASVERKKRETGFFSDRMSFSFRVYVPEKMSTHLKTLGGDIALQNVSGKQSIKTGGGRIDVKNISGRMEAYSAGGDIQIAGSEGTLYAQTEGGDIILDRNSGEIRLKTNGGRITSERTSGTMIAKVGGGNIRADFVQVGEGINLETSAGSIHLSVPDFVGYQLSLSGSRVEFTDSENVRGQISSNRIEGTYKEGGPPIDLRTNTGTVTLNIK